MCFSCIAWSFFYFNSTILLTSGLSHNLLAKSLFFFSFSFSSKKKLLYLSCITCWLEFTCWCCWWWWWWCCMYSESITLVSHSHSLDHLHQQNMIGMQWTNENRNTIFPSFKFKRWSQKAWTSHFEWVLNSCCQDLSEKMQIQSCEINVLFKFKCEFIWQFSRWLQIWRKQKSKNLETNKDQEALPEQHLPTWMTTKIHFISDWASK